MLLLIVETDSKWICIWLQSWAGQCPRCFESMFEWNPRRSEEASWRRRYPSAQMRRDEKGVANGKFLPNNKELVMFGGIVQPLNIAVSTSPQSKGMGSLTVFLVLLWNPFLDWFCWLLDCFIKFWTSQPFCRKSIRIATRYSHTCIYLISWILELFESVSYSWACCIHLSAPTLWLRSEPCTTTQEADATSALL